MRHAGRRAPRVPLYERVNRFFFGPAAPAEDPLENERRVLAAIRAGKGRIGLADVMRVTGLPREQADPMMARLMLDYDGDVAVSEDGGIFYRFPEMRKTASESTSTDPAPAPAWDARRSPSPPLTGNSPGANVAIAALNSFNLLMGFWVIENGMTLERITHLFDRVPPPMVDTGLPIALGVVPLVFSALLFVVPLGRARCFGPRSSAGWSPRRGRLAVLRELCSSGSAQSSPSPIAWSPTHGAWRPAGRPSRSGWTGIWSRWAASGHWPERRNSLAIRGSRDRGRGGCGRSRGGRRG